MFWGYTYHDLPSYTVDMADISLAHNVSFRAEKLTRYVSLWGQKLTFWARDTLWYGPVSVDLSCKVNPGTQSLYTCNVSGHQFLLNQLHNNNMMSSCGVVGWSLPIIRSLPTRVEIKFGGDDVPPFVYHQPNPQSFYCYCFLLTI